MTKEITLNDLSGVCEEKFYVVQINEKLSGLVVPFGSQGGFKIVCLNSFLSGWGFLHENRDAYKIKKYIKKILLSSCHVFEFSKLSDAAVFMERFWEESSQKEEFCIGDKVRVARKPTPLEEFEWEEVWVKPMDEFVGKVFTIYSKKSSGESVSFMDRGYEFPVFCLEKA
jgi:hypothetical protein